MATYSSKFRVFQNWGSPNAGVEGDQNVFVFGPRYALHRYSNADERDAMKPVAFTAQADQQSFEGAVPATDNFQIVDDSFEVYAENAYTRIGKDNESAGVKCAGNYLDGKLVWAGKYLTTVGMPEDEELSYSLARAVAPGDYVAFVKTVDGDKVYDFVAVDKVAIEKTPGEEYGTIEDTTAVYLTSGAPDGVFDENGNLLEGVDLFVVAKLDSVKLSKDGYSYSDKTLVVYNQTAETYYASNIDGEPRELVAGNLFVSFKEMYVAASAGIEVATSAAEVEKVLGKADPENPISMGVINAFVGGAPVVFYFVTAGENVDSYRKALNAAELINTLYYLVPMTQNWDVFNEVIAHIKKMSTEEVKRWRCLVACSAVDTVVETTAKVVSTGVYRNNNADFVTLKFEDAVDAVTAGDTIEVDGTTFVATRMLNSTTVLTTARTGAATGPAKIKHTLSDTAYVDAVVASAKRFGTFRAIDVFPKTYGFDGETYSSMFAAPIIAGMKASVEAQAPITNAKIPGMDDLPDVYAKHSETELDRIAAGGVLIMMQDRRGEDVYVRKQLTTGASNGSLAQSELSMMVNFDFVSYYFDSIMNNFKGSYNVTDKLVRLVRNALIGGIDRLQFNAPNALIGPHLLEGSRVEDVYIDPTNATRLIAHVVCVLPAPFNEMDLYLSVELTTEQPVAEE